MPTEEELIAQGNQAFLNGDGSITESLYLQAAKRGNGRAAHNLGVLFITGTPGVAPDDAKSQCWLNFSVESGFEAEIATNPK